MVDSIHQGPGSTTPHGRLARTMSGAVCFATGLTDPIHPSVEFVRDIFDPGSCRGRPNTWTLTARVARGSPKESSLAIPKRDGVFPSTSWACPCRWPFVCISCLSGFSRVSTRACRGSFASRIWCDFASHAVLRHVRERGARSPLLVIRRYPNISILRGREARSLLLRGESLLAGAA